MQYVSYSSYLVSIEAIARLIYIYETTVKQIFASDCTKSSFRAQKYQKFSGGHAPRPPWRCREQLIKRNPKCCPPPTFHDLPTPLQKEVVLNIGQLLIYLSFVATKITSFSVVFLKEWPPTISRLCSGAPKIMVLIIEVS